MHKFLTSRKRSNRAKCDYCNAALKTPADICKLNFQDSTVVICCHACLKRNYVTELIKCSSLEVIPIDFVVFFSNKKIIFFRLDQRSCFLSSKWVVFVLFAKALPINLAPK